MTIFRHGNPTEILSPCVEWESFQTAVRFGADAVYLGGKEFGMRTASKNFDYENFYQWCRDMKKEGHTIFISEYNMPQDFKCVWEKQITNAMHQTNTKKPTEKLFTL